MAGCATLEIDADQMDAEWAKAKAATKLVKLCGVFYCGLIEAAGKDRARKRLVALMQSMHDPAPPLELLMQVD